MILSKRVFYAVLAGGAAAIIDTRLAPADPAAVVVAGDGKARFTVLANALVRMEYTGASAVFDDRQTLWVNNRKLPVPAFTHAATSDGGVVITTADVVVTYSPGKVPAPAPPAPPPTGECAGQSPDDADCGLLACSQYRSPSAPNGLRNTTLAACCAACDAAPDCRVWVWAGAASEGHLAREICYLLTAAAGPKAVPKGLPARTVGGAFTPAQGFTAATLGVASAPGRSPRFHWRSVTWIRGTSSAQGGVWTGLLVPLS
jgi:hypothetical protein